jgi:hypothetical protein
VLEQQCCWSERYNRSIIEKASKYLYLGLRAPEEGFIDLGCDFRVHYYSAISGRNVSSLDGIDSGMASVILTDSA